MSVVVRMEMPDKCFNCDLRYECNAFYAPGKPKPFMKGCRIVCQLPEGHGRLVDADALHKIAWPVKDHTGRIEECVQMRDLCKAPTIVPADTAERSET